MSGAGRALCLGLGRAGCASASAPPEPAADFAVGVFVAVRVTPADAAIAGRATGLGFRSEPSRLAAVRGARAVHHLDAPLTGPAVLVVGRDGDRCERAVPARVDREAIRCALLVRVGDPSAARGGQAARSRPHPMTADWLVQGRSRREAICLMRGPLGSPLPGVVALLVAADRRRMTTLLYAR